MAPACAPGGGARHAPRAPARERSPATRDRGARAVFTGGPRTSHTSAPAAGQPLTELAAALVDRSARIDHSPDGLVHGDCKPSQFRIAGSQLSLLDFDHCGLADPASDVGTFLASLRRHAVAARSRRPSSPHLRGSDARGSPRG